LKDTQKAKSLREAGKAKERLENSIKAMISLMPKIYACLRAGVFSAKVIEGFLIRTCSTFVFTTVKAIDY
jgi:hypothetical protein